MSDEPLYHVWDNSGAGTYYLDVAYALSEEQWQEIEKKYAAAHRDPTPTVVDMSADFGGIPLVRFPLNLAKCSVRILAQLLCDLENIGFYDAYRVADTTPSTETSLLIYRGERILLTDDLQILKSSLHEIRDQILQVLSGEIPRLDLPEWWPSQPYEFETRTESLEEAKACPYGAKIRVRLSSWGDILKSPVKLVSIDIPQIKALAEDLILSHPAPAEVSDHPSFPSLHIGGFEMYSRHRPEHKRCDCNVCRCNEVWIEDWLNVGDTLERVKAVLAGTRPHL